MKHTKIIYDIIHVQKNNHNITNHKIYSYIKKLVKTLYLLNIIKINKYIDKNFFSNYIVSRETK